MASWRAALVLVVCSSLLAAALAAGKPGDAIDQALRAGKEDLWETQATSPGKGEYRICFVNRCDSDAAVALAFTYSSATNRPIVSSSWWRVKAGDAQCTVATAGEQFYYYGRTVPGGPAPFVEWAGSDRTTKVKGGEVGMKQVSFNPKESADQRAEVTLACYRGPFTSGRRLKSA